MGRVLDRVPASVARLLLAATVVASVVVLLPISAAAQETADPLADPVARGAWLYAGNCVRCHGDYAEARFAEELAPKDLKKKISGEDRQGCDIAWGKARGGTLAVAEINALVDFMVAWEEEGGDLVLPPLPPQPTRTPTPTPTAVAEGSTPTRTPTPTAQPLEPALQAAIDTDPVAHGAWLYARTCVVCHGDYRVGRMARQLTEDELERTVRDGKTGTNMTGFGPRNGSLLKAREISAVVQYVMAWEAAEAAPALPALVAAVLDQAIAVAPTATPTPAAVAVALPMPSGTAPAVPQPYSPLDQLMLLPWLAIGFAMGLAGMLFAWELRGDE